MKRGTQWIFLRLALLGAIGALAILGHSVPVQAQSTCKTKVVGQVDFGSEPVAFWGGISAPRNVTAPGTGDETGGVCLGAVFGGDPNFAVSISTHQVGKRVACRYSVTFQASHVGSFSADFGFPHPQTRPPMPCGTAPIKIIKLIGKGVPAPLRLDPATVQFGPAVPQTDGVFKPIKLVNSTKVGIELGDVSSSNPDFIPAQNCTNTEIDPHSICTLNVAFKPSSLGMESAEISLTGDQAKSPQVIKVAGVGVSSLPPGKGKRHKPSPCSSGLCGKVLSGYSTPVARSAVTLYAVGATYQAGASALASGISNAKGDFALPAFSCPSADTETYVTAIGGDAGAGQNSAVGLIAALGPCGNLDTSTHIAINEMTTVATEWALSQFIDASGASLGSPASNSSGLHIGFDSFANLADSETGNDSVSGKASTFLTSAPCGSSSGITNDDPLERMDTLANILATCVESKGPSSSACANLFAETGASNSDTTLAISHAIASSPQNNAAKILMMAHAPGKPFQPVLTTPPDGWELQLSFSPPLAELSHPSSLTVDADGNIWVANDNSAVSQLPAGDYSCGASTLTPVGAPFSGADLAFDDEGNIWSSRDGITELPAGNLVTGGVTFNDVNVPGVGLSSIDNLTLDAAGDVWVTVYPEGVSELPAGNYGPGATYFNFGSRSYLLTFDPFGNLWVTTDQGLSELPAGNYLQATNHPVKAEFYPFYPSHIGIDAEGDVWVPTWNGVSELPAGNYDDGQVSFAPGEFDCGGGNNYNCPNDIAIDGAGDVWLSGDTILDLAELPASNYNAGLSYPIRGSAVDSVTSLGIDAAGNVWMTNGMSGTISELVGLAKPVMTPLQSCLAFETNNPGQPCVP